MTLREKGIYRTPDGKRLVASSARNSIFHSSKVIARTGGGGDYYLYTSYAWAFHGPADYKISIAGEVEPAEDCAPLRADDLIDTGWTAGDH